MKLFLMSADESGNIDPTPLNQIFKRLPLTNDFAGCDAVVVPVAYFGNYKFNHNLTSLKKPIIIFDFCEFGWPWFGQSDNVLGRNTFKNFPHLDTPEYAMLDKWAADFPATLHFKRDLREIDKTDKLIPVSFLCNIPAEPIQSKAEFDARPIEVFYNWGYSHPDRRRLHGEIFTKADSKGIHILDNWYQDGHFEGAHNWATIHSPHYNRVKMEAIMNWQRRTKITVSMPGAGVGCFRHAEAGVNSIMAMQEDEISWAYPWLHAYNCIRLSKGNEFEELNHIVRSMDLHSLYVTAQESIDKWRPEKFVHEYVIPKIRGAL